MSFKDMKNKAVAFFSTKKTEETKEAPATKKPEVEAAESAKSS